MLKQVKSVTLTGESVITVSSEEKVIVSMSATVSTVNGVNSQYQEFILDQENYKANKVAVRKDISAFKDAIWALEDSMNAELQR